MNRDQILGVLGKTDQPMSVADIDLAMHGDSTRAIKRMRRRELTALSATFEAVAAERGVLGSE